MQDSEVQKKEAIEVKILRRLFSLDRLSNKVFLTFELEIKMENKLTK